MRRDSHASRRRAPVPPNGGRQRGGKRDLTPLLLILGAIPLLLVNWFIAGAILGGTCTSPEDGNMTQCVGGLSEEGTAVAAGAIAAVVLVLQVTLIVLMTRRRRRPNS